ncbi:MAG: hypothetical protein Q9203_006136 [Teloschistes exilis]
MSAPTNPPTPSIFWKLPPEVRVMIYKWHFLQAPEHPTDACEQTSICEACGPGLGCDNAVFSGGVPVGNLLAVAQRIDQEVAPLYTRLHQREFDDLEDMRNCLSNLGPHLRHHIQSVNKLEIPWDNIARAISIKTNVIEPSVNEIVIQTPQQTAVVKGSIGTYLTHLILVRHHVQIKGDWLFQP